MQQALIACEFCGNKLATGGRSVTCDECDIGFHLSCADSAGELAIETNSRLLRSDTHTISCPNCAHAWDLSFDPSS